MSGVLGELGGRVGDRGAGLGESLKVITSG